MFLHCARRSVLTHIVRAVQNITYSRRWRRPSNNFTKRCKMQITAYRKLSEGRSNKQKKFVFLLYVLLYRGNVPVRIDCIFTTCATLT